MNKNRQCEWSKVITKLRKSRGNFRPLIFLGKERHDHNLIPTFDVISISSYCLEKEILKAGLFHIKQHDVFNPNFVRKTCLLNAGGTYPRKDKQTSSKFSI